MIYNNSIINTDADGIYQELDFLLRIPMYRPKTSTGIYQNLDMRLQYLRGKSVLMVTIEGGKKSS
jgi:hypothetical protein